MSPRRTFWMVLIVATALVCADSAYCAVTATVNIQPDVIAIGARYNGRKMTVSGSIPADCEAVISIAGHQEDMTLKEKGRVFGLLWMNLDKVTFHHAPTLYMVNLSDKTWQFSISNPDQWHQVGIGVDWLKQQLEIEPDTIDREHAFNEFYKLKESEGLYVIRDGAVRYGETENGQRSFESEFMLSSRVHPGQYTVRVLAVQGADIKAVITQSFQVEEVGVPAMLSSLAYDHGAVYGVLAVLIAIAGGLLMDFFLGETKGAH